jgi:hypothetical protein
MKRQLELETLEERRHSFCLILLYKVVEGLVPALSTADFVTTAKPKRNIKAKVYKDCETTNIIERRLIKNSKGLKVPDCNTEQTKHSFFVETIVHWNQLPDVCALGCRNTTLALSLTVYKSLLGILHVPETECIVSNYCSFNNNLFQTLKHSPIFISEFCF